MIAIRKGNEPDGLARLRQKAIRRGLSPAEAYALLKNPLKQEVRDKLVEEQGQLCAYCMCRIPRSDVDPVITPINIEHVTARNLTDGEMPGKGSITIILWLFAMEIKHRMAPEQFWI